MAASALLMLANASIEVGILPSIGGRVVVLRRPGGPNILKSDPAGWADTTAQKPAITASSGYKAYDGHTVWLGPQLHWWLQQDRNKARKAATSDWPPDPFHEYAPFGIVRRTPDRVVMSGPPSPITGIQLTKDILIRKDGTVRFAVRGVNRRSTPVTWDLWLNTRLEGSCRGYVRPHPWAPTRIEVRINRRREAANWRMTNGFFHFEPEAPSRGKRARGGKALVYPDADFLAGFSGDQALIIRFRKYPYQKIHGMQGHVEIFSASFKDPGLSLLELEYHSPWKTLKTGESIGTFEEWQLLPYSGRNTPRAHTSFLNSIFPASKTG